MKCPYLLAYDTDELPIERGIPQECIKEECAWYMPGHEACSAMVLAGSLFMAEDYLEKIHTELCLSRYTFRCYDCGLTITRSSSEDPKLPDGWTRVMHVDGKSFCLCDRCAAEGRY